MTDRHFEDLCRLVCVFQSCETSTLHSGWRSDFTSTPPSLSTFLIYYHSLHFVPSSCSPTQFLFGSGLFCCIFLDGLHDDHKCQRASGLEMQTLPQRDVDSSCRCHCCGINWRHGHLLVTQHRQIGFWNGLGWPDTVGGCCWVTAEECQQPRLLQVVVYACLPACVCVVVSAWWLQLNSAVSQDVLNGSTM